MSVNTFTPVPFFTKREHANTMLGFGLVHLTDGCAAPQCIVTRCTLYEQYTTEEALQTAAKSYKGLTER